MVSSWKLNSKSWSQNISQKFKQIQIHKLIHKNLWNHLYIGQESQKIIHPAVWGVVLRKGGGGEILA